MSNEIPKTQQAVQLTGPDELILNKEKQMHLPGPYQVLGKVEAVGLCFSDLKLLKQFSEHGRKGHIQSGIDTSILDEIPSYAPGDKPTVPGHETVLRVCAIGDKTKDITIGNRYLVQTDYRWLPNIISNASFGYNFEGGLQQYVLLDQRVITSPDGESLLIPASEELSASAVALVEPWACVEHSYVAKERTSLKDGGKMLVVAGTNIDEKLFLAFLGRYGKPSEITVISKTEILTSIGIDLVSKNDISELEDDSYDDVIYYGCDGQTAEKLFPKIGSKGLINFVLSGDKFEADVMAQVGRAHYGGIRIVGTTTNDPADSMQYIPSSGEIRKGDKINVIGAGGPMGTMHVIRNICHGVEDVTVYGGDLDNERLTGLTEMVAPLAKKNNVTYQSYNPKEKTPDVKFDYTALMAPVPQLVTQAILDSAEGAILNIFAGIPASVNGKMDLNVYIEKHLYMIGTSGSVLSDMKSVLAKVEARKLDTDLSVSAITGLDGAVDGIRAVENHLIPGKIIVYPSVQNLGLTKLEELKEKLPQVASNLAGKFWTKQAEDKLLA
ncbi:MAG: alcohol dehydrogenase catalytic domain-containing protein [Planctomycetes bacterium]|nr:alcohol dehydrogenase catalytic domain-containing protein [Planctomycetota bacterium]